MLDKKKGEKQSVYSTAPADWAKRFWSGKNSLELIWGQ